MHCNGSYWKCKDWNHHCYHCNSSIRSSFKSMGRKRGKSVPAPNLHQCHHITVNAMDPSWWSTGSRRAKAKQPSPILQPYLSTRGFWQQASVEWIYRVSLQCAGHLYYITWKENGLYISKSKHSNYSSTIINRLKMTASESSNIWSFTIFDSNSRQVDKWGRCIWIAFRLKFSQLEHATCMKNLKHLFSVKLLLSRAG